MWLPVVGRRGSLRARALFCYFAGGVGRGGPHSPCSVFQRAGARPLRDQPAHSPTRPRPAHHAQPRPCTRRRTCTPACVRECELAHKHARACARLPQLRHCTARYYAGAAAPRVAPRLAPSVKGACAPEAIAARPLNRAAGSHGAAQGEAGWGKGLSWGEQRGGAVGVAHVRAGPRVPAQPLRIWRGELAFPAVRRVRQPNSLRLATR